MTNPLVAERQDSTTGISGIGIAESAVDLYNGISSGSWIEGGLGLVGTGLEALSLAIDPIGTLLQYGISWLIEHIKPLSDALDWLAGDADTIASYSQTWRNVSQAIGQARTDFDSAVQNDITSWTGDAADSYRTQAAQQSEQLSAASTSADTVGTVVQVVGVLVGAVREIVRDLIADCIATLVERIPQWLAEEGLTLGLATPHVVASAVALIAKWVNRVTEVITKLVRSIEKLRPLLTKLDEIWDAIKKGLHALSPHAPDAPNTPELTVRSPSVDTPTVSPDTPDVPGSTSTMPTSAVSDTPTLSPDGPDVPAATTSQSAPSTVADVPSTSPSTTPGGVSPTVDPSTTPSTTPGTTPGTTPDPVDPNAPTSPAPKLSADEFDNLPVDDKLRVAQSEVNDGAVSFTNDADAVTYGQEHWNDYVDNLPPEQRQALFDYTSEPPHTGPTYQEINGALRGSSPMTPEVQAHINDIDNALAGNPISEPVVITRGTGLSHIGMDPQDMVGQTFTEDAYLSTSLGGPAPAFDSKDAVLHLQVPAGTPGIWVENVSAFGAGERELLLGRGLQYHVDRVVFEGGQWHVFGQYLPVK